MYCYSSLASEEAKAQWCENAPYLIFVLSAPLFLLYMYALLRSLLIFICELNYQFVSCLFSCQLHCQVMSGEVAKANPNFCVGRWAACFLITLFMGWWGSRGGGSPGQRLLHLHSWLLALQSLWNVSAPWSLPFTLAFFCFDAAKEGQYGKWKGHS